MEKTPFKLCPNCHNKYAKKDSHDVCNLCLADDHDEDSCPACAEFIPKTIKTRRVQRVSHWAMAAHAPYRRHSTRAGQEEALKYLYTRTKAPLSLKRRTQDSDDPEQRAPDVERKRRILEAEMVALLQRKDDFEESIKEIQSPPSSGGKDLRNGAFKTSKALRGNLAKLEEVIFKEKALNLADSDSVEDDEAWEDTDSLDEAVYTYPSRPSPPDDLAMYNSLIGRAAETYGVQLEEEKEESCFLLEKLMPAQRVNLYLPMLPSVLDQGKKVFNEPASAKGVTPRVQKKYKPSSRDPIYIKGNVPADSIIVATARKRANASASTGPPPEAESKKMELIGKRMEREAATQWRISNSNALLNRYAHEQWDKVEELMCNLSEDLKKKLRAIVQEGRNISNTCLKSALDAADTASRQLCTGSTLRRYAWLRVSGFKPNVQASIINMPFTGSALFGPAVDEMLQQINNETTKSMVAMQFTGSYTRGRSSTRRPTSRGAFQQATSFHQQHFTGQT